VLKLNDVPNGLHPLQLGSSTAMKIGDPVVAIGSPFGLQGTVTTGIVSALNRELTAPDGFTIDGAIQTDAAINPGNSGGPLLDGNGRVIGINSQIATQSGGNEGIGYAVPIESAKKVAESLIAGKTIERPFLGVSLADATTARRSRRSRQAAPPRRPGCRPATSSRRRATPRCTPVTTSVAQSQPSSRATSSS
jgi:S1-C subfamily serine protease